MFPGTSTGTIQGTISTQNVGAPNGNAVTPSSTVSILDLNGGYDTATIQVTGTYTGALSVQVTLDGSRWETVGGTTALINVGTAATSANIPSATVGIYQMDVSGLQGVRVTALAAVGGAGAVVTIQAGIGSGVVGIDTPITLAAGTSSVGTVATPPSTAHSLLSAATTNATSIKSTAGNLFETTITNFSAAPKFVKFYDKASAPTVGTDAPIFTATIPANSEKAYEFGNNGKRFAAGIALAITGAQATTDTTAVAAGDVRVHSTYV